MALDPRYVIAPSLQSYFVDKTTGLPLAGGQVFFYVDGTTNLPKPVYELSGSLLTGYTYTQLPNPLTLSAVGTMQDASGNDIIPYYFPYDASGKVENYFIEVYDSNGVLQFSRSDWPNFFQQEITNAQDITNFIPNGQFLLHNNIPATAANNYTPGKVSLDTTNIAPGGWTFERGPSSTSTDFITFPEYNGYIGIPTTNPRYAVQVQCTAAVSQTRKDLCVQFPGVNTFAGTSLNFYFNGISLAGNISNIQVYLRLYFGTGGSPSATVEVPIGSPITLTSSNIAVNIPFTFPTTGQYTVGTNNDDYAEIAVRFPTNSSFNAKCTDFALVLNDIPLAQFPQQSEAQQIGPSTAGSLPTPDPNGLSLYLPTVMGPNGLIFDNSSIGKIEGLMVPNGNQTGNLLYCDGTAYLTQGYSNLGIPYSRLQSVLFNTSTNSPLFGTGLNFVNNYINSGTTNEMIMINNSLGNPGGLIVDTGATGFTINPIANTYSAGTGFFAYPNASGYVYAQSATVGAVAASVSAGTSGMSMTDIKEPGIAVDYYSFQLLCLSAAALAAGSTNPGLYFDFYHQSGASYRFWFFINGEVAPAAGGHTLVQVNLDSTMAAADVARIIAARISGYQQNSIKITALPTAGTYFTFFANSVQYYVWYQINGAGTAPAQAFTQLIKVSLTGGETNAQVASKTQAAINSQFFAVPDLRGYFLRGNDATSFVDTQETLRYSENGLVGSGPGTYQWDDIVDHYHGLGTAAGAGGGAPGTGSSPTNNTQHYGFQETRPVNASVNWFIRY